MLEVSSENFLKKNINNEFFDMSSEKKIMKIFKKPKLYFEFKRSLQY